MGSQDVKWPYEVIGWPSYQESHARFLRPGGLRSRKIRGLEAQEGLWSRKIRGLEAQEGLWSRKIRGLEAGEGLQV